MQLVLSSAILALNLLRESEYRQLGVECGDEF